MCRKNWLLQTASKKRMYTELAFCILYGALIGLELANLKVPAPNPDDPPVASPVGYLLLIVLSPAVFQQSCLFILNTMVKDKESKMKESLKIMGLNKVVYGLSYLAMQAVYISLTSACMAVSVYAFNTEQLTAPAGLGLFAATWLLGLNFLGMCLVLQNFFSSPKLAPMLGPVILFLPTGVALFAALGQLVSGIQNTWIQYMFWLPTFPYEVIICALFQPGNNFFVVPTWVAWVTLVVLTPLYFLVHLWLEAIIPDAYGITKPCCFCL